MKGLSRYNSMLIGRKIKLNLKMPVFQEIGIESKLLNQNSMILVSFSFAEDALSNGVKNMTLLARKVLKIHRSAFFGTPGIVNKKPLPWRRTHQYFNTKSYT